MVQISYVRPARLDELTKWLEQFDFISPVEAEVLASKLIEWADVIITSHTAN